MIELSQDIKPHTTTTVLWPFFWDHPGEPVPEENFWTLWCKERLTETETPTIRLGATPSGLTSAHLHHPPFFTGWMPFLLPNQQDQSTEGKTSDVSKMGRPGSIMLPTTVMINVLQKASDAWRQHIMMVIVFTARCMCH